MISSSDQFHQLYSPISDEGTSFRETLFYGQNQRVEELNDRIYDRNKSDISLEPNFDPRSISTKYAKFPIIMTTHTQNTVAPIHAKSPYMIHTNFSPANRQGPVSGYLSKFSTASRFRLAEPVFLLLIKDCFCMTPSPIKSDGVHLDRMM